MKDRLYEFLMKAIIIALVTLIVLGVGAVFYEGITNGGFNGTY